MKIRILILILLLASLSGYSKNIKPNNVQKFINNQLKNDTLFQNAIVGIMAIDSKGNTIAEWNSNLPLLTASTMKTITTGCALYYLGTDYKFSTKIAYTGEIKNGILNGDIFIEGGGDPTLGSKDTVAFAIDSIFGIWRDAIKKCGINKINGNIIVDDSYFQREPIPDSWEWGNLGPSYGSSPSGLAFCENMQYFKLTPGKYIGDKASISIIYPMLPGLKVINEVYTAEPKSGDQSWYYVQDMSMKSKYTGTIPIDRDSIISDNSNLYPYLSCGFEFKHYLLNNGIEVYGGVVDVMETETNPQRHYIAETYSPELWRIVNVTNRISNNFYAETILKAIGKKNTGIGNNSNSTDAIKTILKDSLNINIKGFNNADGSGLSRRDQVTPAFFCRYYTKMESMPFFNSFFESFPISGGPGTLKNVLKNADPKLRKKIHAKSGSLSGVRCYAGYVEENSNCKNGKKDLIKFAILVNNYATPTSKMQPKIEQFLLQLAKYHK